MAWYERADAETRDGLARHSVNRLQSPGLSASEDMAQYLWDGDISAVASECASVEAWSHELPCDKVRLAPDQP
jgi:hypothetical protein